MNDNTTNLLLLLEDTGREGGRASSSGISSRGEEEFTLVGAFIVASSWLSISSTEEVELLLVLTALALACKVIYIM